MTNHHTGFSHTCIPQLYLGSFCILIGQLVWEKTDLIRDLKHLAAMLWYMDYTQFVQVFDYTQFMQVFDYTQFVQVFDYSECSWFPKSQLFTMTKIFEIESSLGIL